MIQSVDMPNFHPFNCWLSFAVQHKFFEDGAKTISGKFCAQAILNLVKSNIQFSSKQNCSCKRLEKKYSGYETRIVIEKIRVEDWK